MPGLTPIYTKIRGKVASSHEYTCPSLLRNLVAGYAGVGLVHVRAEEVSGEEEEEIFLFRIFFFFSIQITPSVKGHIWPQTPGDTA